MMMEHGMALMSILILLAWVPFAIIAGLVDTWHSPGGRAWRTSVAATLVHPVLSYRASHLHAHA
jgi:hypothetical protein